MNKIIVLIVAIMFIPQQWLKAEIKLPAIVSSNMVLQRDATIQLWGWANPNEKISIKTSWLKSEIKLEADEQGSWKTSVKTTNSKESHTIQLKSKESDIKLDNILFGEVWICSGQSNMEQNLKGNMGQPTYGSAQAIAKANNPNLRLFTVGRGYSKVPQKDLEKYKGWQSATPASVKDFSAVGYFFGQQLQEILDVPVGLILSSWGGTPVQTWMSKEAITAVTGENLDQIELLDDLNNTPTILFNAMINPLMSYTIKGAIWYQGETNRYEPDLYKKLFPAMVKDWRSRWGIGDFPFYYVQIAPYMYKGGNDVYKKPENSAFIREVQLQCLELIPNSGIAISMDIGDDYCIHPPKKKEVADRLLYNALNKTYGYEAVQAESPVYESYEVKDGGILMKFKNPDVGLYSYEKLEGFEIAGEDKVFYPAIARIKGRKEVFVKSDKVPNPVAVRYAWQNWIIGTLYNTNLLPASSFRTDNWEDATRSEKKNIK